MCLCDLAVAAAYQAVHSPNQVPQQYVDPYNATIADQKRRTFAGMLSCMDEGIGNITEALRAKGMLDDTLIVFSTDNVRPGSGRSCAVIDASPCRRQASRLHPHCFLPPTMRRVGRWTFPTATCARMQLA